jgi:NADPH2:quinone reductase
MQAITISRYGEPDVLTQVELPDPHPGPGQLSIDVTLAAVGMIDVIFRRGDLAGDDRYPAPPFVPGIEVAGTVREVGDGVSSSPSASRSSRSRWSSSAGTPRSPSPTPHAPSR